MSIDKLLAVLDMDEDGQSEWLFSIIHEYDACCPEHLAFRLRDEVVVNQGEMAWHKAEVIVCEYMGKATSWLPHCGLPIHWTITALVAKEKERQTKTNAPLTIKEVEEAL